MQELRGSDPDPRPSGRSGLGASAAARAGSLWPRRRTWPVLGPADRLARSVARGHPVPCRREGRRTSRRGMLGRSIPPDRPAIDPGPRGHGCDRADHRIRRVSRNPRVLRWRGKSPCAQELGGRRCVDGVGLRCRGRLLARSPGLPVDIRWQIPILTVRRLYFWDTTWPSDRLGGLVFVVSKPKNAGGDPANVDQTAEALIVDKAGQVIESLGDTSIKLKDMVPLARASLHAARLLGVPIWLDVRGKPLTDDLRQAVSLIDGFAREGKGTRSPGQRSPGFR